MPQSQCALGPGSEDEGTLKSRGHPGMESRSRRMRRYPLCEEGAGGVPGMPAGGTEHGRRGGPGSRRTSWDNPALLCKPRTEGGCEPCSPALRRVIANPGLSLQI